VLTEPALAVGDDQLVDRARWTKDGQEGPSGQRERIGDTAEAGPDLNRLGVFR
jgi:hypothetical protein